MMHSAAIEDYLTAILRLEDRHGVAATKELADRLAVAQPSVTGMLKKLAREGLVTHERYRGSRLTDTGREAALSVLRRHRLLETFLVRELRLAPEQVHREACRLEHALSDEVVERLDAWLGRPEYDPHGTPIPGGVGGRRLREVPAGATAVVVAVHPRDPEHAAYLAALGLNPGAKVTVRHRRPFDGPVDLEIAGRSCVVGAEVVAYVSIEEEER